MEGSVSALDDGQRHPILVVGSANMDMVVSCERFPRPGETILGDTFGMYPGGKGANQAVACAKLGGTVCFIGKMGHDAFREQLAEHMIRDGVNLDHLLVTADYPTGIALISVDRSGQNQIIVASGSNMQVTQEDLEGKADVFRKAAVVLLQLEIPLEAVQRAALLASAHGATVILNPAPARNLPDDLLRHIDFITPNKMEAGLLAGIDVTGRSTAVEAARHLLKRGVRNVIVTMGEEGALWVRSEEDILFPAVSVETVDTTAAGDAFNGALAFALATGLPVSEAIRLANHVGAYAVTKEGAQPSMPTRDDLDLFLASTDGDDSGTVPFNPVQL